MDGCSQLVTTFSMPTCFVYTEHDFEMQPSKTGDDRSIRTRAPTIYRGFDIGEVAANARGARTAKTAVSHARRSRRSMR
jgi:hypothetical protein